MNGDMPKPHGYLFERCEFMYPDMLDKEVIDDPTTLAVYTADQMREYAQEATRQAMEECRRLVLHEVLHLEDVNCEQDVVYNQAIHDAQTAIANRIRALSDVAAQEVGK